MITIKAFRYPNVIAVQIFDPTIFSNRNNTVYSRPIKVYQGIDNPIQIIIKNQDQKPVDMTGYAVSVQIQDPTNQVTINSYAVTFADITNGQGNLVLDQATINLLGNRFYKLTTKVTDIVTAEESPLYIDANYGVPIDLEILPAYWSTQAVVPTVTPGVFDGGTI